MEVSAFAVFGVGVAVVLLLLFAALTNHQRESECAYQGTGQNCEEAAQRGGFAVLPLAHQSPDADQQAQREEWRREQDLYAQRRMADAAWYAVFVAFLGVTVTVVGVAYVKWTLDISRLAVSEAAEGTKVAKASMEITRRMAAAQLRAQVQVRVPEIDTPTAGQVVKITTEVTNSGQTPAYELRIFAIIEFRDLDARTKFAEPREVEPGFSSDLLKDGRMPVVLRTIDTHTDAFNKRIAAKKSGIFVTYSIAYQDDFSGPQTRSYRYVYDWRNLRDSRNRMFSAVVQNDPDAEYGPEQKPLGASAT